MVDDAGAQPRTPDAPRRSSAHPRTTIAPHRRRVDGFAAQ
jgi:hypothetical protein